MQGGRTLQSTNVPLLYIDIIYFKLFWQFSMPKSVILSLNYGDIKERDT